MGFSMKSRALKFDVASDLMRENLRFCNSERIRIEKSLASIIVLKSQWISRWY